MQDISILWLRVATVLYAVGLVHVLFFVWRRSSRLFSLALPAFFAGVLLHAVSIVEQSMQSGHLALQTFHQTISACAILIAVAFLVVYKLYDFSSLAIFIFPVTFLLAMIGATAVPVEPWGAPTLRDAWLLAHVLLVLGGYAAMLLMAGSSVFYLLQERHLKSKSAGGLFDRLPPLGTLDSLSSRSMAVGFVCTTAGVITGCLWAYIESGTRWISEGRVHIALFTWIFYLVVVYLRASAGWRGRRAAFLSIYMLMFSALTWVSHTDLRGLLAR
ncbi:MAG: inner membrane protein YpjD [Acidobacteriota bacterium]|jgi:ABC-type uncharacterized transport system permease subunit|nr:cytochrome c biogenesis protein [Bryobacteraceae bacterium CoA2 C42]MCA2964682.1 cytochrome c biogenesis protein CcsA [Acidobacteriaceae bacterium]